MSEDTLKRYTSRKFCLALLGVAMGAYGLANVTEKLVG